MSVEQAGQRYLELTCVYNEVNDRWALAVDQYEGEPGTPVPDDLRALAAEYAAAAATYVQGLQDPAYPWPIEAGVYMQEWMVTVYGHAAYAEELAKPDSVWQFASLSAAGVSDPVSRLRLELGLGPAGTGCDTP
jgi:hypothetical protein